MIPELGRKRGLVVMTNSLEVAAALRELENEPTLLMTGGTWDPHSESFQGQVAEQVLHAYDFDQLFIGAAGIDPARGTTTFNELIGLSRVMAEVAREVILEGAEPGEEPVHVGRERGAEAQPGWRRDELSVRVARLEAAGANRNNFV